MFMLIVTIIISNVCDIPPPQLVKVISVMNSQHRLHKQGICVYLVVIGHRTFQREVR
jgi:hypothetical protein